MFELITIRGKQRELKFTYKSMYYLEVAWDEEYLSKLLTYTPTIQTNYLFYAMLVNIPEFEGITLDGTLELIQECLENNDFDMEEYFTKVSKAHTNSMLVNQLFKQSTPSGSVGTEQADETRRGGIFSVVRGIRNYCTRVLVKYA